MMKVAKGKASSSSVAEKGGSHWSNSQGFCAGVDTATVVTVLKQEAVLENSVDN